MPLSIVALALFLCGCPERNSTDSRIKISAAIYPNCQMGENYTGNYVRTQYQNSGAYVGSLLMFGQDFSENKEIGVFIPWPPPPRTEFVLPHPDATFYYDPNRGNNSDADQYGAISGSIWIADVTRSGNYVTEIHITFTDVKAINAPKDTLCFNGEMYIRR